MYIVYWITDKYHSPTDQEIFSNNVMDCNDNLDTAFIKALDAH